MRLNTRFVEQIVLAIACLLVAASGRANMQGANMLGTVTDLSSTVDSGITVKLENWTAGEGRAMPTNPKGDYRFRSIPSGIYPISAEHPRFRGIWNEKSFFQLNAHSRLGISSKAGQTTKLVTFASQTSVISTERAGVPQTKKKSPLPSSKPILFNQDSSEFFVGTFGSVEPNTVDHYVDSLGGTGITDLLVCVNAQRTNYRSSVWEADWDGYDPQKGDDQPFFAGIDRNRYSEREWIKNGYKWSRTGVDYPKRMLTGARRNGMRAWISVRMNDAHYPDNPRHPYHSTFWKEHPDWHLANGALDYSQSAVRQHYLELIREICSRYDLDGLELDFMRFGHFFPSEHVFVGSKLMTSFVREVKAMVAMAAVRLSHPVKLAVRVPSRPWIAQERGLDVIGWAKESLVDLVIAAPWWASTQSDVPVETWRGALAGTATEIAVSLEDGVNSGPAERRTMTPEEARGVALTMLSRGADATYLFNWFTGPLHEWRPEQYREFLTEAGSQQLLSQRTRRVPVTLVDPWTPGEPGSPTPLQRTGSEFAVRIPIGPRPGPKDLIWVRLDVSHGSPPNQLRVNGIVCSRVGVQDDMQSYEVPASGVRGGYNLLQLRLDEHSLLRWAEIRIEPH